MKTLIINIDTISSDKQKDLLGFILTTGLNFRKINEVKSGVNSKVLFVETETRAEEIAFKSFLSKNDICMPVSIERGNKAILEGKNLGTFTLLTNDAETYFQDVSTGKKFTIVRK
jgi:hypothetical protein